AGPAGADRRLDQRLAEHALGADVVGPVGAGRRVVEDQLVVGVGVEVDADERGPALAEGALADRRPGHLSLARDLADAELAGARVIEEQLVASVAVDVDRRDRRPAARPRAGGGPAPGL